MHIINPAWLMADLQPAPKLNTDPQKSEEQDPVERPSLGLGELANKHLKNVKKASELHRRLCYEEPTACLLEPNLSTILRAGADWNDRRA